MREMELTRVVLLLASPGGHCSAYYATRAAACAAVREWHDRQCERMRAGELDTVETTIFQVADPDDGSLMAAAILAKYIIGMYVAADRLTPSEDAMRRIAAVAEKEAADGDDWKGE